MKNIYLLDVKRTAVGKLFGSLGNISAVNLAATVIKNITNDLKLIDTDIDFAYLGNAVKAGLGQNPARQAIYHAGLGFSIPSYTIDMVCGSGLMAVGEGFRYISSGEGQCVIAGGMESSSMAPYILEKNRNLKKMASLDLKDSLLKDGLFCSFAGEHMGFIAERTAKRFGVSRKEQDDLALASQQKAMLAEEQELTKDEIVPVSIGGGVMFERDENIRSKTSEKKLARLTPLFGENGSVTAGNAPPPGDAAAIAVIASEEFCKKHEIKPKARILSFSVSALPPEDIFLASGEALKKAIEKSGLKDSSDIDYFEVNESFGVQAVLTKKELNIPDDIFNIWGGAIAIGHPLGASGVRLLATLLNVLQKKQAKYGAASICLGGGCAVGIVIENLSL